MIDLIKDLRKKKQENRGFTLMEVLGVVGIMIALFAIIGILIFNYLRTMYQLKLDNTAKEIFISAQNHLSMADGENFLGRSEDSYFGTEEIIDDKQTGVYYFVVNKDTLDRFEDDTVLSTLLPYASIDEAIRSGNSFVIRYHKDQAMLLDVFYGEPEGRYPHGFEKAEYTSLIDDYRGDENKAARRKYSDSKAVIGYYGGVDEQLMARVNKFVAPKVTVYNEERLYVEIDNRDNSQTNGSLRLLVSGKSSGKSKYVDVVLDGQMVSDNVAVSRVGSEQIYRVVLDDITTPTLGFNAQFASAGLIPGENIIIKAIAYTNSEYTNIASSGRNTTNSLYATYDESNKSCEVGNIRHIENLYNLISDVAVEVDEARQITDIVWGAASIFNRTNSIYEADGTTELVKGSYVPIRVASSNFKYDGNNNHSISGIYVDTNTSNIDVNTLNGGLFSDLSNGEVRDLRLVNFDINSYNGTAGALIGSATATRVSGVIAYNSYKDDSDLGITANLDAGGLIGLMNGGQIELSAAAVYVRSNGSNSAAGGLVAYAYANAQISDSYSGGHTNEGRYTNNNDGKGRYNVISNGYAGGLVGEVESSSISYSYTTSSTRGNSAGGLIGRASASDIDNTYCTGRVSGTNKTDNFVAVSENSCTYTGNNYYLIGVSENADNIVGATAVASGDISGRLIVVDNNSKRTAYVHDTALEESPISGKYSFKTVSQWHSSALKAGITNVHYGDWQIPTLKSTNFTFYNDDTLRLVIDVEKKTTELTLSITGEASKVTKLFQLKIQGSNISIVKEGEVDAAGNFVWLASNVTSLPIAYDDVNRKITVALDNITNTLVKDSRGANVPASNKSFYKIFGDYYLIGENITARVANNYHNWSEMQGVNGQTQNTSFAKYDQGNIGGANIAYLRHLQNLDPVVSKVNSAVSSARQLNDISWKSMYNSMHNAEGSKSILNTFYGIYNENIALYNGNNKEIVNLPINSNAYSSFGGEHSNNAALFRYVNNGLTLSSVKLKDFTVTAIDGHAASAIAESAGATSVSIINTLASNKSMSQKISSRSSDSSNPVALSAGGLIGRANSNLTIRNSSASVQILTEGFAGGLIGIHDENGGTLIIDESFTGGHTSEAKYITSSPETYNVVSTANTAGGLIGYAGGSYLEITKSFSAASVSAQNRTYSAGGIIGTVDEQTRMDYVYVVSPVDNIKVKTSENPTNSGAFIGKIASVGTETKINNTNTYYLPEIYEGNNTSGSTSAVQYVGDGYQNKMNPVLLAYYTKDGQDNVISGKISTDTLSVKTYAYDEKLNEDDREYPFSIWTSFAFEENGNIAGGGNKTYGTFYGDWQPVLSESLKTITATFYYRDPITNEVKQCNDANLGVQQIVSNKDNNVLLPRVENFAGYKVGTWTVQTKSGIELVELVGSQGFINLSQTYTTGDLNIVANYVSKGYSSVIFMYDPSGNNQNYQQISGVEVSTGTSLKDVKPVPSREIDGYEFVGWFSEENGQGTELKFDSQSTQVVDGNMVAYAKYKEIVYLNITIDFMYVVGDDAPEYLINIPRYRIKDKAQYQIKVIEGDVFDEQIDISDVTQKVIAQSGSYNNIDVGKYNDEGQVVASDEIRLEENDTKLKITTDTNANYVITYYVPDADHTGQYKYNIKFEVKDTKAGANLSNWLEADQYEKDVTCTFTYVTDYGQIVGGVAQAPEINWNYFQFTGFECQTTAITLIPIENKDDEYDVIIKYERDLYPLVFDSTSGTYFEPVELAFGQPLRDKLPATNPSRTGYSFVGWNRLVPRIEQESTLTWDSGMPACEVKAIAQWQATQTTYKIIYWKQKVTDDKSLNINGINDQKTYDFAAMETRTANTGSTVSGDFAGGYTGTMTIGGKTVKLDGFKYLRSDSAQVAGDGSTVISVYFDRRVINIHFSTTRTGTLDDLAGPTNNYIKSNDEDAIYIKLNDGTYETLVKRVENGVVKYYRKVEIPYTTTITVDDLSYAYVSVGNITNGSKANGYWWLYEDGQLKSQFLYYNNGRWYKTYRWWVYSDEVSASNVYARTDNSNITVSGSPTYYQFYDNKYRYVVTPSTSYVYGNNTYTEAYAKYSDVYGNYNKQAGYWYVVSGYYNYTITQRYLVVDSGNRWRIGTTSGSTVNDGDVYVLINNLSAYNYTYYQIVNNRLVTLEKQDTAPFAGSVEITEYAYEYQEWTGDRYKLKYPFIGLFEQPFSMYDYEWPGGKKYSLGYYHGDSGQGIVFLGAFIAPDNDKYNVEDIYIYKTSDTTSRRYYFCLQGLDGMYVNNSWDIGYSASGGTFNFTNKYEGFQVAQYTYTFNTDPGRWNNINGSSINPIADLYVGYSRNSYALDYVPVVDGVLKNSIHTANVLFEDLLSNHKYTNIDPTIEANNMTYTWDGKYYSDQACTREFDFNITMPSSSAAIYLRYILREYTVNFNINDPNPALNPATYIDAANHQASIVKEEGQTIDSIVANSDGSLKDAYKAQKAGYVFDESYWYYLNPQGPQTIKIYNPDGTYTEQNVSRYINSQELHGDNLTIDLYCRWYEEGEIVEPELRDITVRYVDKDNHTKILAQETIERNKYVNTNIVVKAKEIEGYYPEYTMQYYRVSNADSSAQIIYFEYYEISAWLYDVEYYVRYSSYEEAASTDELGLAIEPLGSTYEYLLLSELDNKAYEQYAVAEFNALAGFDKYHLAGYDFVYKKEGAADKLVRHGTGTTVSISPSYEEDEKAVVRYYLQPDVSKVEVDNIFAVYDGTDKRLATVEDTTNTYTVPDGMTSSTLNIFKYFTDDGNPLNSAIDAGSYKTKGYVVLKVDDKNFLLYKTPDDNLSLVIGKRYVDISSGDLTVNYDEQMHSKLEYTITGEIDGSVVTKTVSGEEAVLTGTPFVGDQGVKIYSATDAGRLEPGSSDNGFTYELTEGTNPNNYVITTGFGKLTVFWNYEIKIYAEYTPVDDETFAQLWPTISSAELSAAVTEYLVSDVTKTNITKKSVTIEEADVIPAEYSSYKLNRFVYNGVSRTQLPYSITPYKIGDVYSGVLEVYLEPDLDLIMLDDVTEVKHDLPEVEMINIRQLPTKINAYADNDILDISGLLVEARLEGGEVVVLEDSQYSTIPANGETISVLGEETTKTVSIVYGVGENAKILTFDIGIDETEPDNVITPLVETIVPTIITYADGTSLAIKETYELKKYVCPYLRSVVIVDEEEEYEYSYLPRTELAVSSTEGYPIDIFEVIKIDGLALGEDTVSTKYFLIKKDTSKSKIITITDN